MWQVTLAECCSLLLYCVVQGGLKSDTCLVFQFPLMLSALYFQFLFTHVSFLSSADVNKFCFMRIHCILFSMVGFTNDERCLIHNLRVEKHWGFPKNYKHDFNLTSTFKLWIINSKC